MYKVLIVEDNQITKNGLVQNIQWEENGIEILAAVDNGLEAMKIIENNVPDVVLADIVMPLMDGLSLTKELKIRFNAVKVILLSAHNEFEYAQQAVKQGVFEYIMKPVVCETVLNTVKRAIEEKRNDDILISQVKKSIPILRERLLVRIVEELTDESLQDELNYVDICFNCPYYIVVVLDIDNCRKIKKEMNPEEFHVNLLKIKDIITDALKNEKMWFFESINHRLVSIIGYNDYDEQDFHININGVMDYIKEQVTRRFGLTITIGLGNVITSYTQLPYSYKGALKAIECRFLLGSNQIIDIRDLKTGLKNSSVQILPFQLESMLVRSIRLGNRDEAAKYMRELKQYFEQKPVDEGYYKIFVLGLISSMIKVVYESDINTSNIELFNSKMIIEMDDMNTMDEMFLWLENLVYRFSDMIANSIKSNYQKIILKIKDYIQNSYWNEDLGLNELARVVSITPSYLSAIFKRETNIHLIDYMTKIRMEKATELLCSTNLKIFEVGMKVGYSNPYYFSAAFKKYFGKSPSELRK